MRSKNIIALFVALVVIAGSADVFAQSPAFSIFDSFERTPKPGEGKVIVHQSEAIKRLVGTRIDSENVDVVNGKTFLITQGYRVRVYSGNNQTKSRGEAIQMETKIKSLYKDIATYVTFYAPFWKLHIGNYRSFEEASLMLRSLHKEFPKIKNEIYIIEEDIRLPLD
jgi:hypothetical protein